MDVFDAIRSRRTTKSFKPNPLPRPTMESRLEAGNWAPNHKLTQPWTFTVLEGAARTAFASLRRALAIRLALASGGNADAAYTKGEEDAAKVLRAPTLVLVSCHQQGPPLMMEEDLVATAAAVENMLLAATALGVGSFWSTGPIATAPEINQLFGLEVHDKIVGIVQFGYSDDPPAPKRAPAAAHTRWIEPREVPKLVAAIDRLVPERLTIGNR